MKFKKFNCLYILLYNIIILCKIKIQLIKKYIIRNSIDKTIFKILAKILYLVIIKGSYFNAEVVELVDTLS